LVAVGWVPTAESYLGRVTKARILEAVREAKGEVAMQRIELLKKGDMAVEAERLLAGTGWLPEPLRTAGVTMGVVRDGGAGEVAELVAQAEPVANEVESGEPAVDPDDAAVAAE
jgi:ParB family transcriptional regulator, chromosome partitioning protein